MYNVNYACTGWLRTNKPQFPKINLYTEKVLKEIILNTKLY